MFDANGPGAVALGTADAAAACAEIKAVLRVASDGEDALIAAFAETALGLAEQFIRRVTIARAMGETLDARAAWQPLGAGPVRAITAVAAVDGAGVPSTLPVDAYAIDIDADGTGWVRIAVPSAVRRIVVSYSAGIADQWSAIPAPIRQGACLLAAHLFTERDEKVPPPAAVTALWRPFRVLALDRAARC